MGEFIWHVIDTRIKQEVYVLATEKDGRTKSQKVARPEAVWHAEGCARRSTCWRAWK
jgi:hypothetical protein